MHGHTQRERGFTIIELLIVLIVVAILAMIVVPRLMGAGREAREARLRADLRALRSAVQIFRADMGGHPSKLDELLRHTPPNKCRVPPDGYQMDCLSTGFRGPYLTTPDGQLPVDAVSGQREWRYDRDTGHVNSEAEGMALDGTPYPSW
jgi:general secretion pathway protein G